MDVLLGSTEGVLVGVADGASASPSTVGGAGGGDADVADDGSGDDCAPDAVLGMLLGDADGMDEANAVGASL